MYVGYGGFVSGGAVSGGAVSGYGGFVSGRSVRPVSGRFVSPDAPTTRALGTTLVDRAQASGPGYLSESARRQVQSARL
jgi:hypothetical protein